MRSAVAGYCSEHDTDLFLYSGGIHGEGAERFVECVSGRPNRSSRATLFLTTFGGDLHAAYRMVRSLQQHYPEITLLIVGPCKSAGTLIAIGSTELVFGPIGELGPLDVQMVKQDEILPVSSGLDSVQALALLTDHAFMTFESYLLKITSSSRGSISTKTASHIG